MTTTSQCRIDGCDNEAATRDGRCRPHYGADYYRANKAKMDEASHARYEANRTTTRRRPLDPNTSEQKCCDCKRVLELDQFHRDRTRPLGGEARCKECRRTIGPGAMIHGCHIGAGSVVEPGAIVCDGS